MKITALIAASVFSLILTYAGHGACITTSNGQPTQNLNDFISKSLAKASGCPKNVFEFRELILANSGELVTTMVANRGFHNPSQGSFSFFEIVSCHKPGLIAQTGDVFFGHFTGVNSLNQIDLEQTPSRGSLMIEAFAWDEAKGFYNFYELIGDGAQGRWFYRGDSADILSDLEPLHLQPNPKQPAFGNRLRCSGCHMAGGPIMKELNAPHNDWWTKERQLDFGGREFSENAGSLMAKLVSPSRLADSVKIGLHKLEGSAGFNAIKANRSLRERLRPLFAPVELNLESDLRPSADGKDLGVPTSFFIDSRLLAEERRLLLSRQAYERGLHDLNMSFPETNLRDGDHGWLTPVKAYSDQLAVESLISQGLIDQHFARAVLSIDFTNPLFSEKRRELLRLLPQTLSIDWQPKYIAELKASGLPHGLELADLLTNGHPALHDVQSRIHGFVARCEEFLGSPDHHVENYIRLLGQRRQEVFDSEISKNPRGQILEPGFRVIFPEPSPKIPSQGLLLREDGEVSKI